MSTWWFIVIVLGIVYGGYLFVWWKGPEGPSPPSSVPLAERWRPEHPPTRREYSDGSAPPNGRRRRSGALEGLGGCVRDPARRLGPVDGVHDRPQRRGQDRAVDADAPERLVTDVGFDVGGGLRIRAR